MSEDTEMCCSGCGKVYSNNFSFCPHCGKEREDADLEFSLLPEQYRSPYGVWQVSKVRNKGTRHEVITVIGTFKGYLDDIILNLKKDCDDYLLVEGLNVKTIEPYTTFGSSVDMLLTILVDGRHPSKAMVEKLFEGREVVVKKITSKGVMRIKRSSKDSSSCLGKLFNK